VVCGEAKHVGTTIASMANEYQRKGLGTKLMDMLIEIAEEKGLESIYGIILSESESMIRLCKKMRLTIRHTEEEAIATLTSDFHYFETRHKLASVLSLLL